MTLDLEVDEKAPRLQGRSSGKRLVCTQKSCACQKEVQDRLVVSLKNGGAGVEE